MKAAQDTAQPTVDSRQRILDAATRLMSERGYAGTSISMITKLSGLPASSTYWHFGSKEQLLSAVIESAATSWLRSLKRWSDMEGTPRERLAEMMRVGATDWSGGRPAFLRLIFMIALESNRGHADVLETVRRVRTQVKRTFLRAFREEYGAPDDEATERFGARLAALCLAIADGVFLAGELDEGVASAELYQMLATAFFAIADDYRAQRSAAAR
jgi:AcrR family transcriptional regulator